MTNPEQRDPIYGLFDEYESATAAETRPRSADQLRRKAVHLRIGRTAVAGAAALALIAPATWVLANVAGADGQEQPQAGAPGGVDQESPTAPADPDPASSGTPGAEDDSIDATDIVGATVDMPSFVPGDTAVEDVCGSGDTVVVDGTYHGAGVSGEVEEGETFLLVLTNAAVTEEDRVAYADGTAALSDLSLVGYFGCDFGDEFVFQTVVLENTGEGTWTAEQLVHSEPGGEVIKGVITGNDGELLVGFAERWDPGAVSGTDTEHWIDTVRVDENGTVVREPSEHDYWSIVIDSSPMFSAE
jgi:hypothetical protein